MKKRELIILVSLIWFLSFFTVQAKDKEQYFIENKGQWAQPIKFASSYQGYNYIITDDGPCFDYFNLLKDNNGIHQKGQVFKIEFINREQLNKYCFLPNEIIYNFFKGNTPDYWAVGCRTYKHITEDIWDGISIAYYFDKDNPRYDFIVSPNANPSQIKFKISGADRVEIRNNQLVVHTKQGEIFHGELLAYQPGRKSMDAVPCNFELTDNYISFKIGEYDKNKVLIIDPVVFSTFFGGTLDDEITDITYDKNGEFVVSGWTTSPNFRTTTGAYDTLYEDLGDAFISKYQVIGSKNSLKFSTLIGTTGVDRGSSVDIDIDGNIYLAGTTNSSKFPITTSFGMSFNGEVDAFFTKFNSTGSALIYSSYLGGSKEDYATKIEVNTDKNAFITGYTNSTNFPFQPGAFQTRNMGMNDAFIAKVSATGSSLEYCTYLGGAGEDKAYSISVIDDGTCLVVGETSSGDFPTWPFRMVGPTVVDKPFDYSYNGKKDAFITKVNTDGSKLDFSSFFGGSENDIAYAVTYDVDGTVYLAGETVKESGTRKFPIFGNAYNKDHNGGVDCFLAKLDKIKTDSYGYKYQNCLFSTFFGGSGDETTKDILRQPTTGIIYATGYTNSSGFPVVNDPGEKFKGKTDIFYIKFGTAGNDVPYSTLIGADGEDYGNGIAIDETGQAIIAGKTSSNKLVTTNNNIQKVYGGGSFDGFIAKCVIGDLNVINPVGRDKYCPNSAIDIRWQSNTFPAKDTFIIDIYRNGNPFNQIISENATGTSYSWTIPDRYPSATDYQIRVAHKSGLYATHVQPFTIQMQPVINQIIVDPVDPVVCEGDSVKLGVWASGSEIKYQWFLNGKTITAARDSILHIKPAIESGTYHVVVSGVCQPAATSNDIQITVKPATRLLTIPRDTTVKKGGNITLSASAKGLNLKWEWFFNGSRIFSANDSVYHISNVFLTHAGIYSCIISGDCGIDSSYKIKLTVDTSGAGLDDNQNTKNELIMVVLRNDNGKFELKAISGKECRSRIALFDNFGRFKEYLFSGNFSEGENIIGLDLTGYSQGLYWLQTECGNIRRTDKLILVK